LPVFFLTIYPFIQRLLFATFLLLFTPSMNAFLSHFLLLSRYSYLTVSAARDKSNARRLNFNQSFHSRSTRPRARHPLSRCESDQELRTRRSESNSPFNVGDPSKILDLMRGVSAMIDESTRSALNTPLGAKTGPKAVAQVPVGRRPRPSMDVVAMLTEIGYLIASGSTSIVLLRGTVA
jgi:hypothetical protein